MDWRPFPGLDFACSVTLGVDGHPWGAGRNDATHVHRGPRILYGVRGVAHGAFPACRRRNRSVDLIVDPDDAIGHRARGPIPIHSARFDSPSCGGQDCRAISGG